MYRFDILSAILFTLVLAPWPNALAGSCREAIDIYHKLQQLAGAEYEAVTERNYQILDEANTYVMGVYTNGAQQLRQDIAAFVQDEVPDSELAELLYIELPGAIENIRVAVRAKFAKVLTVFDVVREQVLNALQASADGIAENLSYGKCSIDVTQELLFALTYAIENILEQAKQGIEEAFNDSKVISVENTNLIERSVEQLIGPDAERIIAGIEATFAATKQRKIEAVNDINSNNDNFIRALNDLVGF